MSDVASSIGEAFVLGFRGPSVPDWLRRFATRFRLGGVILFDYDVKTKTYENNIRDRAQLTELCETLHSLPSRPLIYIDQEGGKVRRLKESLGFSPLPSAKQLAAKTPSEALSLMRHSFAEMKALGIDVNLAPVVDLDLNPENPDIGAIERSPSSKSETVLQYGRWFETVAEETGLGLCLKHYPGLGAARTNSHHELTEIPEPQADQLDLFFALAQVSKTPSVLVSHAICRRWSEEPISVSQSAIAHLRAAVPEAVLLTDDVQMQGLQKKYRSGEAAYRALAAGNDLVILGNNLLDEQSQMEAIAEQLLARLQTDRHAAATVADSLRRVRERKAQFT